MIVYRAGIYDHEEYYTPDCEIGLYSELEVAKQKAVESSRYLGEEPYVETLQLQNNEFVFVEKIVFIKEKETWETK